MDGKGGGGAPVHVGRTHGTGPSQSQHRHRSSSFSPPFDAAEIATLKPVVIHGYWVHLGYHLTLPQRICLNSTDGITWNSDFTLYLRLNISLELRLHYKHMIFFLSDDNVIIVTSQHKATGPRRPVWVLKILTENTDKKKKICTAYSRRAKSTLRQIKHCISKCHERSLNIWIKNVQSSGT